MSPWLVGLGLAGARIAKGPRIHFVAYACGALLVLAIVAALFCAFFTGPVH